MTKFNEVKDLVKAIKYTVESEKDFASIQSDNTCSIIYIDTIVQMILRKEETRLKALDLSSYLKE